jgi:diaminopimelate epimerase
MQFEFFKYHSNGNDFVIIDNRNHFFSFQKKIIQEICSRQFCVGADGLILLEDSKKADFRMRIYNSDGFEASMCGNGLLCLVKFINDNVMKKDFYNIETNAAIYEAFVEKSISFKAKFPKILNENCQVVLGNLKFDFPVIDSGVFHGVIFLKNLNKINAVEIGRKIRFMKNLFPMGINVNFCEIINDREIKVRTYEKGVENETYCCSTGALAVSFAFYRKKNIKNPLILHFKGGKVEISIDNEGLRLTQKPIFVFKGSLNLFDLKIH